VLHIRYTTLSRARFPKCFSTLTPCGAGIENPRVGGSIPTLGTAEGHWPPQARSDTLGAMALPMPGQRPAVGARRRVRPDELDSTSAAQGVREAAQGKLLAVTEADLEHWAETGEWPASSS
jgi:hypothetical protein